jgi:hypothetical protein
MRTTFGVVALTKPEPITDKVVLPCGCVLLFDLTFERLCERCEKGL